MNIFTVSIAKVSLYTLIVYLICSGDAFAHGGIPGGIDAIYLILGVILSFIALILLGLAFFLKHHKKTPKVIICILPATLTVILGLFLFSSPTIIGAINPWYDEKALFLSLSTIVLIVGLLFFFYQQKSVRLAIIFVTFSIIIFEAFITPYVRIFYPNQPFASETITIKPYDCQYFGLPDGKILHIADQCIKIRPRDTTLSASIIEIANTHSEKSYRLSVRVRVKKIDPFRRYIKKNDKWELRNPFLPKYETAYVGEGKILEDDWQTTGEVLARAIGGANNYSMEWVKKVIEHGADINIKKHSYGGLLYNAIVQNDYELAKVLVEAGRDLNLTSNGQTPLHLAASRDHKLTKLLLDHGADMAMLDKNGLRPIDVTFASLKHAERNYNYDKKKLAELLKIKEMFLKNKRN